MYSLLILIEMKKSWVVKIFETQLPEPRSFDCVVGKVANIWAVTVWYCCYLEAYPFLKLVADAEALTLVIDCTWVNDVSDGFRWTSLIG